MVGIFYLSLLTEIYQLHNIYIKEIYTCIYKLCLVQYFWVTVVTPIGYLRPSVCPSVCLSVPLEISKTVIDTNNLKPCMKT